MTDFIPESIAPHLPLISHIVSTVVMVLLAIGLLVRHNRRAHIPIMLTCFVVDVVNVLVIELNRGAIAKTIDTATKAGDWILKFHVAVSLVAVVCYLLAIVSGTVLARSNSGRGFHKKNAGVFIVSRVLNYVTSFMV